MIKGIIAVAGLPGSGKSYFARHLAAELDGIYLSSDLIRKEILASRTYSEEEKGGVYDELVKRIYNVEGKEWVVADATFHKLENRAKITEVSTKRGVPVYWIMVTADEEIIRNRLKKPRPDSDANYEVYQMIKDNFEPFKTEFLMLRSDDHPITDLMSKSLIYIANER